MNIEMGCLQSLIESIESHFNNGTSTSTMMNSVAQHLKDFGALGMRSFITEVLQKPALLSKIAHQSYLHKNGFYKVPLAIHPNFSLRLHVWLPGTCSLETLHDHRWYLASTILTGTLQSEIWQSSVRSDAQFYDEYLYVDKDTEPTYLGKAKVAMEKTVKREAGEAYVLNPGTLHRIIAHGNALTATLMCRSHCVQNWSRNIIVNQLIPDVKPNYLTPAGLETVLKNYLTQAAL